MLRPSSVRFALGDRQAQKPDLLLKCLMCKHVQHSYSRGACAHWLPPPENETIEEELCHHLK